MSTRCHNAVTKVNIYQPMQHPYARRVREYFALNAELRDSEQKYKEFIEPKKRRWQELRICCLRSLKELRPVQIRFIQARLVDAGFQIVWNHDLRQATEELKCADMG